MLTVSIAMATFNGALYLRQQLESLRDQTILPNELVVTDDGSTDDTLAILESFSRSSPFPVRVYQNEQRLGFRMNFMKCSALCAGDLISFCDQDDVWERDKISSVLNHFVNSPSTLLAYHNSTIILPNGNCEVFYPANHRDLGSYTRYDNLIFSPFGFSITINRNLLQFNYLQAISRDPNNNVHPEAHDQWFFFVAKSLGGSSYLPERLVQYRQHATNAFGWHNSRRWSNLFVNLSQANERQKSIVACLLTRRQILALLHQSLSSDLAIVKDLTMEIYKDGIELNKLRKIVYNGKHAQIRLRAMYSLLRRGAYGTLWTESPFGLLGAFKDLIVGVPLGRRFRTL